MRYGFTNLKHNSTTSNWIEEKIIKTIGSKNTLMYKRFWKDCIFVAPENKINNIFFVFYNFHPKLKFIIENDINNSLNFIHLTLIKGNNKIDTIS